MKDSWFSFSDLFCSKGKISALCKIFAWSFWLITKLSFNYCSLNVGTFLGVHLRYMHYAYINTCLYNHFMVYFFIIVSDPTYIHFMVYFFMIVSDYSLPFFWNFDVSVKLIDVYRNRHNTSNLNDPVVATRISDLVYESKETYRGGRRVANRRPDPTRPGVNGSGFGLIGFGS